MIRHLSTLGIALFLLVAAGPFHTQKALGEEPQGAVAEGKTAANSPHEVFQGARRAVFLGDSITHGGQYIEMIEAALLLRHPELQLEVINVGLPSETVSGLSEPGHAGGKFPRPDVHERLVRMFDKLHPDVVFACYGMNCGIYHPLSEERFRAYRNQMQLLHDICTQQGARVVHLTPPPFDPLPLKGRTLPAGLEEYRQPYENYDEVLDAYSKWLLSMRDQGWDVVDLHGPMNDYLKKRRETEPQFVLAGDGVHQGALGHFLMAREALKFLEPKDEAIAAATSPEDLFPAKSSQASVLELVAARQRLRKDAWLFDIGHKRPGMGRGKPLDVVEKETKELDAKIQAALKPTK